VDEKNKPLSETITDAQIANLLGEHGLEADAENIDLVRSSRKMVEKYLEKISLAEYCSKKETF